MAYPSGTGPMEIDTNEAALSRRSWIQAPGMVARRVAGELVLVPVEVKSGGAGEFFVLNAAGESLWATLANPSDLDKLAQHLIAEYGIDSDTARQDAARFVEQLVACGAIRAHEGT